MSSLRDRIEGLRKAFEESAGATDDARALEELRNAYLGRKKCHITLLFEDLKSAPAEEKREAGRLANELKDHIQGRIVEFEGRVREAANASGKARAAREDMTLPGRKRYVGTPHPLTLFEQEIERVFLGMGFTIEEGPEIARTLRGAGS